MMGNDSAAESEIQAARPSLCSVEAAAEDDRLVAVYHSSCSVNASPEVPHMTGGTATPYIARITSHSNQQPMTVVNGMAAAATQQQQQQHQQ